ncbi:DUF262 domain-containing protein [Saccharopolyspora karakumensis]|uniref:DUF262 domain-containing protein n=1 Tax=Saccharopolyspora karakumensis TaxID=2530386 RepID=A0A4R5BXN9_9PSEU|nr:DUF262 domain-containing protein [Saccharopolyspora karakumensis]TDD91951.1 DUF262 domain-containing protein [Saccharopolyspora karakumensis]
MSLVTDDELGAADVIVEDPETDEDEVDIETPSAGESLRYFGVDFDVEGLVRRFEREELIVPRFNPPDEANQGTGYAAFQRNFVWKKKQMDRFIESILLGYPVPGIFLVELESRQYIVLDGQQRLTTLRDFYRGQYPTPQGKQEFSLTYVTEDGPFFGKTYATLTSSDQRLLNNALIQATVVVPTGDEGKLAVYALFERINSGGTKLNEQQIRVAIYNGSLIKTIREMNDDISWRILFGSPPHRDLKDQELILRYLSLKKVAEPVQNNNEEREYKAPLASFMTKHLDDFDKNFSPSERKREMAEFSKACSLLVEASGKSALRRNRTINAARTDSILVGLTLALRNNPDITVQEVAAAFNKLESDKEFKEHTEKSTSHRRSVTKRIERSVKAFQGR